MYIDWYLKQTYPKSEADSDYEHVHTSMHSAGTRSVCVNIGYLEGHIKIAEYKVKAMVCFDNPDDLKEATDTVDAYKPIADIDTKLGVYGKAELWSQSYDGDLITIVCYTSAWNPTDRSRRAHSKFRHTLRLNDNLVKDPPEERTKPSEVLSKNGGTYNESDILSEPVGEIRVGQTYNSEAYIRLTVSGIADTWHVLHDEDFTYLDNR